MKQRYIQKSIKINNQIINYYEIGTGSKPLLMIHAQGTDARSYENVLDTLKKQYHVFALDCPGHGSSSHDKKLYALSAIGKIMIDFIDTVIGKPVVLTGHSSGGLICAYVAANSNLCSKLILEDPPFFACEGERRFKTFNYLDLSTVCHNYITEKCTDDFILYYFKNQKMWDFFPEKSREKAKAFSVKYAAKYRKKHPDKTLKVPFWPKSAMTAYIGMQNYDPHFGDAFYTNSFNAGIDHAEMLSKISCETINLKAKTNISADGILLAANSDEDAARVKSLIPNCQMILFDCGHGIHIERKKEFLSCF